MIGPNPVCVVYVTVPSLEKARDMARLFVEECLVACANIFPVQSIYRWQGRIEEEQEFQLLLKTTTARFAELQTRIAEIHPYENPEIIQIPVTEGAQAYLEWIHSSVK